MAEKVQPACQCGHQTEELESQLAEKDETIDALQKLLSSAWEQIREHQRMDQGDTWFDDNYITIIKFGIQITAAATDKNLRLAYEGKDWDQAMAILQKIEKYLKDSCRDSQRIGLFNSHSGRLLWHYVEVCWYVLISILCTVCTTPQEQCIVFSISSRQYSVCTQKTSTILKSVHVGMF